ncbi:MAG TPA: hypothetical protein VF905_00710 [Nitrospirota bacterium]
MKGRIREVNHEIFLRGYKAVKAAKHIRFDPYLVERSIREGGTVQVCVSRRCPGAARRAEG